MRTTILVTGANGQIGRMLVTSLSELEYEVVGLDRLPMDTNRFIQCDLLKDNLDMLTRMKWDIVVHLAGDKSDPPLSMNAINSVLPLNVVATIRLLDAISNYASHLIYASSISVYGNVAAPYREEQLLQPRSLYGASKAAAEKYISSYELPMKTCILRIAQVVGPGTPQHIAPVRMIATAKTGKPLHLTCTNATVRDYVHLEDVVKAVISVCRLSASGVFNIGSAKPTELASLAKYIAELSGVHLHQTAASGPEYAIWMSTERAQKYLHYEPSWTVESWVKKELQKS